MAKIMLALKELEEIGKDTCKLWHCDRNHALLLRCYIAMWSSDNCLHTIDRGVVWRWYEKSDCLFSARQT